MISGEDIKEEALKREKSAPKAMQDSFYYGFREGAKWIQEQCHKDLLEVSVEIEKQHVQDVKDLQKQMIERACDVYCQRCRHQSTCPPSE